MTSLEVSLLLHGDRQIRQTAVLLGQPTVLLAAGQLDPGETRVIVARKD